MMKDRRICARCVSDTSIPDIRFDDEGVCNFCKMHDELEKQFPLDELGQQRLSQLADRIKAKGKNKRYDCIVGISGGTDSTYCLYLCKQLGLRPLAVHFDNGWDSDIAANNMKNAVARLGVDLRTIKCDWDEYRDLQISFLKASVSEAEIPTDIAILTVLHQTAAEEGLHYVINGHSFRTEGLSPQGWTYMDGRYIESVQKTFGTTKLKSFPNLTISKLLYYVLVKRIHIVPLLAYVDYRKEDAKRILQEELDWTDYGGHHFESVYTRFIIDLLWKKFKIDKRIVEQSALVRSGQMTRDRALKQLEQAPMEDEEIAEHCVKKLGLSTKEYTEILLTKPKASSDYSTYYPVIRALRLPIKLACMLGLLPHIFYEKYLG